MNHTHKGYTFRQTSTTTTKRKRLFGREHLTEIIVHLYEIDGLKERGQRPFLTSIKECREFIGECLSR